MVQGAAPPAILRRPSRLPNASDEHNRHAKGKAGTFSVHYCDWHTLLHRRGTDGRCRAGERARIKVATEGHLLSLLIRIQCRKGTPMTSIRSYPRRSGDLSTCRCRLSWGRCTGRGLDRVSVRCDSNPHTKSTAEAVADGEGTGIAAAEGWKEGANDGDEKLFAGAPATLCRREQ